MIKRSSPLALKSSFLPCLLVLTGILCFQSSPAEQVDLIRKDGIVLKLDAAQLIISKAKEKAVEMDLQVNITVVDPGGHLLAFARMDGARPASIYTSLSKAQTAALKLSDTGIIGAPDQPVDTHLNLSIENTAAMNGGPFTTLDGGVTIVLDGQVVGGIGVGGAKGSEDAVIAKAGLAGLQEALGK